MLKMNKKRIKKDKTKIKRQQLSNVFITSETQFGFASLLSYHNNLLLLYIITSLIGFFIAIDEQRK